MNFDHFFFHSSIVCAQIHFCKNNKIRNIHSSLKFNFIQTEQKRSFSKHLLYHSYNQNVKDHEESFKFIFFENHFLKHPTYLLPSRTRSRYSQQITNRSRIVKRKKNKQIQKRNQKRTNFPVAEQIPLQTPTGIEPGDRKTIYQSLDNWSLSLVPAEVELLSVLH